MGSIWLLGPISDAYPPETRLQSRQVHHHHWRLMPDETVVCTKCKTENPLGQDHCNSCGSLLKGHSFGFDKHPENINVAGVTSAERKEKSALILIEADGLAWDDLDGSEQMLALAASSTKATAADRKAYMQHVVQKLKPAPKIGRDQDDVIESVIIESGQIENAVEALNELKRITKKRRRS